MSNDDLVRAALGHNNPPEPTIEEVVLSTRQTKDEIEMVKAAIEQIEAPFLAQAKAASAEKRAEKERLTALLSTLTTKVAWWQEKQRRANPFADPKDVSRVIIDGDVAATIRAVDGFEITKGDMVPREFCKPDDIKIKMALSCDQEVPGVRRIVRYTTIIR